MLEALTEVTSDDVVEETRTNTGLITADTDLAKLFKTNRKYIDLWITKFRDYGNYDPNIDEGERKRIGQLWQFVQKIYTMFITPGQEVVRAIYREEGINDVEVKKVDGGLDPRVYLPRSGYELMKERYGEGR